MIEHEDTQAADAAAAREAAELAKTRGEPTEADLRVERDQRLDEAKAKAADRQKAEDKARAKPAPQQRPAAATEAGDDKDEAPLYEEPSADDRQWAVDSYGAQVATAMDKAGINPVAANAYYQANGKLPDSAFEKLQEAGYPRAMVETYLGGVKAATDTAANEGKALAGEVTKLAGGKAAYDRMTTWASQGGMTNAELQDFNAVIDSKNAGALRIAVRALRARFEQANGKLPRVNVTGQQASRAAAAVEERSDEGGDVFKSTAEISAAQRDPKYQRDPAYRKAVEQKVARSNLFGKARRPAGR